ncbi:GL10690 [Drosophila persimilis]|uniref:GL10690 n=2 Tax=Drosophila persimilis TaxID=7234 RepID=B4GAL3_DROPE|nr:GL10690 [Drosophila persimilis]
MGYLVLSGYQKVPEMPHQLALILISFLVSPGAGEPDCSQRPDLNALKNCCKMPLLELSKYTSQCGQYLVNGAHITPCSFECLFEAAKALNGTSLVMENIRKMMETLLESHQEFVDIYTEGFHHCSGEEQAMIKSLKRRRMPITGKCSSMSVMYGLCAHRYVYRNCPESASSKSTMCIEAREYSIHCE